MQGYSLSASYDSKKLKTHQNQFLKGDYLESITTEFSKYENHKRIHLHKKI